MIQQKYLENHFIWSVLPQQEVLLEQCIVSLEERSFDEKKKLVTKLHKQFAYPSAKWLEGLLQDAGTWDQQVEENKLWTISQRIVRYA